MYLLNGDLLGVVAGHLHVAVLVLGDDAVRDLDAGRRRDVVLRVRVADAACAHHNKGFEFTQQAASKIMT